MRRFFTIGLRVVVIAFLILASIPMEIQAHESTTTLNALILGEDAKYYVQIPEAIAFGKLSKNKDNEISYTVSVQVIDLNGGSIEVSAEQEGNLIGEKRSQDSVIPFENKFNKISLKENKDLEGNLYIRKEAVASTKQGNYKGVVNFTMSYMLGNTTPTVPSNPGDNGNNNNNGNNSNNGNNNNNSNNSNNGSGNNNNSSNNTNNNGNNSLQNNTYTAKMSLRKETDINSTSMCDSLFFGYADIVVQGENAQITFYVIDPIPQYPSEGTPLSDIVFETSGQKYEANIDTSNKVIRMYDAASGFIPSAGKYPSDVVTVTVPTSAVENSASGALKCSAYVNAVMKSIQSFYIVFSDLQAGETSENLAPTENLVLTSPSGSGTSSSSQEDTKTLDTSNLSDGTYSIPISAMKETTNEASMMNEYMYPYAQLEVANKKLSLTVHIQHQVAGIEGGGPEYISYEGVKAAKKAAGFTNNGMNYDSFTIELGEQINTTMLVTMYVNAMSIEVKARLILDLSQLKEGATKSGMESGVKTAAKDSTEDSTKDDTEGEYSSDHDKIVNGNREIDVEKNIRVIRFMAQSTGIKILLGIIAVVLIGILGIAGNLRYRRRSI